MTNFESRGKIASTQWPFTHAYRHTHTRARIHTLARMQTCIPHIIICSPNTIHTNIYLTNWNLRSRTKSAVVYSIHVPSVLSIISKLCIGGICAHHWEEFDLTSTRQSTSRAATICTPLPALQRYPVPYGDNALCQVNFSSLSTRWMLRSNNFNWNVW